MSQDQVEICLKLGGCSFLPGSFDKRFAQTLSSIAKAMPDKDLSEKQNEWMFRLLYKYRKQLPQTYEKHKDNPLCSKADKRHKTQISA